MEIKEMRELAMNLQISTLSKLKTVVFSEINFVDFVAKRTETDGDSTRASVAVRCEFHDTTTFDAGRLVKRNGNKGEYWLYFCNNPICPVHGNGLNLIKYNQAVMEKENNEEISPEIALLDLYCNYLGYEPPKQDEMPEKTQKEKEDEEDRYLTNLLNLYITRIARKQLAESPDGMKYLNERKIPEYLINAFQIGYLPSGFKLSEILLSKGFTEEFLIKKTILSANSKDTLFDRIIIPMFGEKEDPLGVNFSFKDAIVPNLYTRTVTIRSDKDKAYKHRYLNRNLPFFNIQACMGKKNIILVEGIMDCLSVLDSIIKMKVVESKQQDCPYTFKPSETGVVATYGTNGLSEENMKKYLGSFQNIILAADNDDNGAGQTANIKRAKLLKTLFPNANIKIVSWKEKDANDMLKAGYKPEDFWECIENSIQPEYFIVNNAMKPLMQNKNDILSAFKIIDTISPLLKEVPTENPLELYKFVEILSKKVGIPIEVILLLILGSKKDVLSLINSAIQE